MKMTKNRLFPTKLSFYKNLSMNGEILISSLNTDESRVRLSSTKSFKNDIAAILVDRNTTCRGC